MPSLQPRGSMGDNPPILRPAPPPEGAPAMKDPWDRMTAILRGIVEPVFAPRTFDISLFGAVGDGTTDCTSAFRDAIGACHAAGGGRVRVPAGDWLSGAIHLK